MVPTIRFTRLHSRLDYDEMLHPTSHRITFTLSIQINLKGSHDSNPNDNNFSFNQPYLTSLVFTERNSVFNLASKCVTPQCSPLFYPRHYVTTLVTTINIDSKNAVHIVTAFIVRRVLLIEAQYNAITNCSCRFRT